MTTQPANLGALEWEDEVAHAEVVDTQPATRLQIASRIDASGLVQEMIPRNGTYQVLGDGDTHVPGPQGGSFSFDLWAYGHGSATDGALSVTPLATLLGKALGNVDAAQVGGAITSATAIQITQAGLTVRKGGLIRAGALGDGRAEGQVTVSDDAASPYDLLAALPAAPNNTDKVRAMLLAYPAVTTPIVATTQRFLLQTANQQFFARGCANIGLSLRDTNEGQVPRWTFTEGVSRIDPANVTFPSATAVNDKAPAAVAGGWLWMNANNVTTRAVYLVRDFEVDIIQQVKGVRGNQGASNYQVIHGWRRLDQRARVRFKVMAPAATTTPTFWDLWRTNPNTVVPRRILWQSCSVDGSVLAMHFQRCIPIGNVPTQTELDDLGYIQLEFEALAGTDTTNELTRAPFVIGMG